MESQSLKRPEMIISISTAIGLIGSFIYLYRRENSFHEELNTVKDNLAVTIKNLQTVQRDTQVHSQHLAHITAMTKRLKDTLDKHMDDVSERLEEFRETLDELKSTQEVLISTLRENDIDVDLSTPSRKKLPPKKNLSRRPTRRQNKSLGYDDILPQSKTKPSSRSQNSSLMLEDETGADDVSKHVTFSDEVEEVELAEEDLANQVQAVREQKKNRRS